MASQPRVQTSHRPPEEGFALVGLVVAIFLILLALSVAAPTMARALRREREVETMHRANEYVNAIRRYHIKTGAYPGTIEQLEKANNVRYLRQKYNDPMTGKPDWRLIKVGENKTTVKGFFGQPLAGLNSTGIGGSSTNSTTSPGGINASGMSATTATTTGSTSGSSPVSDTSSGSSALGSSGTGSTGIGSPSGSSSASSSNQSAIGSAGSGAPFMGVGVPSPGASIATVNEKTTYPEWEFLYDPRIEQLRGKVNIFGGGISSTSSSSLGSLNNSTSTSPTSTQPGNTSNPTTGSSPSSGSSPQP